MIYFNENDPIISIIFNQLFPILGGILSFCIFLSPIKIINECYKAKQLNSYNPIPLPFMVANGLVWFFYGLLTMDYYVLIPNGLGFFLGLYFNMMISGICSEKLLRKMIIILIGGSLLATIGITISMITLVDLGYDLLIRKINLGSFALIILLLFYSSPLSTLVKVIKERNAIYFEPLLTTTCLLNGLCWTAYGIAQEDIFIAGPNGVGAIMAIIQFICILIFGRKTKFNSINSISISKV